MGFHGSPMPQAEVRAPGPSTPVASPASFPFTLVGHQLPVLHICAVHFHFPAFSQGWVSPPPVLVQPCQPSEALLHPSSQQLSFIFQLSPGPLSPLNSPDHSVPRILRTQGAHPPAPLAGSWSHTCYFVYWPPTQSTGPGSESGLDEWLQTESIKVMFLCHGPSPKGPDTSIQRLEFI